jgi:alcohol dehydrogenase class IV
MSYEFGIGPDVLGGSGSLKDLGQWVARKGAMRPLILTDPALVEADTASTVQMVLHGAPIIACVTAEPTTEIVAAALDALRDYDADLLVGLGGGSSIDTAKLAGLLATNRDNLASLASDWGLAQQPAIPLVAIPTTVGSGSEMTRGAVFKDTVTARKLVIVSDHLSPRLAVLDPHLMLSVPRSVVAATGCDALTQGIEGVLSTAATAWTDALHLHGLALIRSNLARAAAPSTNMEALGRMQEAAAMIGAGLARSGVGAVHAVANTLGGHFPVPHGVACATLLMPVLEYTGATMPERFASLAPALGAVGSGGRDPVEGVLREVRYLLEHIGMGQHLSEFGVEETDLPAIAREAAEHTDMASSPARPDARNIEAILREAL